MKIYKSDVYTTIALILLVVCFTFPAIAFYKVPQKIAAGQIDSIPSYVYPLWNLYQKGRYVSPYTPKGAEGDLKKMIEKKGEVGMMSFPVWYVALEAPNYPKAAFPEGIPVWFHVDGFSGDIHEMNTINHYVGMYPTRFRPVPYAWHLSADDPFHLHKKKMVLDFYAAKCPIPAGLLRLLFRMDVLVRTQYAGMGSLQNQSLYADSFRCRTCSPFHN